MATFDWDGNGKIDRLDEHYEYQMYSSWEKTGRQRGGASAGNNGEADGDTETPKEKAIQWSISVFLAIGMSVFFGKHDIISFGFFCLTPI